MGVNSRQLLDHKFPILSFQVSEISHKERHCRLLIISYGPLFIPENCTTAACDSTGCKLGTLRTELGTCAQPLYRCKCSEQVKTCLRMTSWTVPWLCGVRRGSIDVRRRLVLNPVVCSR
jgi:hypothetical protein